MNIEEEINSLKARVELLEKKFNKCGLESKHISSAKKELSIKEFILSKTPQDDTQKTLLVSYYLEKFGGYTSFNVDDIAQGFIDAKEKAPGNINDRINGLIRKGWVMKKKEKKNNKVSWTLTNSGEKVVDDDFPKE